MKSEKTLINTFGDFKILQYEEQNKEYEGVIIEIARDKRVIRCRLAKRTPKKEGYFVAFWEKDNSNTNTPFKDISSPDYLAIIIDDDDKKGIFILPKEIAISKGILSTNHKMGKMAMRFYPPWCTKLNNTARKTQQWQNEYFKSC